MGGSEGRRPPVPSEDEEFRSVYQQAFPLAFRVGYRLSGRRDDAEDAAQEALARAYQRWSRLRGQPWVVGWILTTTLNILRRRAALTHEVGVQVELAPPGADVEMSLDLWTAVSRLPKRQAQAVILYYLADLPVAHVATVMGCREGTAKAHLDRARKRLARSLERSESHPEGE